MRVLAPVVLRGARLTRFNSLAANIMVWDLSKGIPFDCDSVDVVYHLDMLEHLDQPVSKKTLLECKNAFKAGSIHRIVVPNLEILCRNYPLHISAWKKNKEEAKWHEKHIELIIDGLCEKRLMEQASNSLWEGLLKIRFWVMPYGVVKCINGCMIEPLWKKHRSSLVTVRFVSRSIIPVELPAGCNTGLM